MYFLLSPPEGASVTFLTGWMLVFTLGVRVAFTSFAVPWNAVAAELSEDYRERTSIITCRIMVGWVGGIIFIFLMYSFVFPATAENENGLLVLSNYRVFGIVVRFPRGTRPGEIDADTLFRLAFTDGIGITVFYLVPIVLLSRYSLTVRSSDILTSVESSGSCCSVNCSIFASPRIALLSLRVMPHRLWIPRERA